jgi:hypothetical protein
MALRRKVFHLVKEWQYLECPMQQLSIRLYQTDDELIQRMPDGVDALASYIRVLSAQLNQPEFEHPPPEDRAVVIAIFPTGKSIGWAINQMGDVLKPDQQHLERTLQGLEPPIINGGAVVFAIHYAQSTTGADWIPLPKEWNAIAQGAGGAVPVDKIIEHYFESTSC